MERAQRRVMSGTGGLVALAIPSLGAQAPALAQLSPQPVVADAATRLSLAAESSGGKGEDTIAGGKDAKGIYLASGETKIYLGGNTQFRYFANSRDTTVDQDEFASGFGFRRARLSVQGNLSKELAFIIQGDFLSGDSFKLFEAFATYAFTPEWVLCVGQFKPPLLKEELTSLTKLQAVERSTVNSTFTQNYSQGVQLGWTGQDVRAWGSFNDGLNALNTNFISSKESDYALTARGEWKWSGDWKQFDEFTSWRGREYAGYLAGALHFQDGGETVGTPDTSVFQYTLDTQSKGDGWNFFASFIGRNTEPAGGSSFDDFGAVVSGGYLVSDQTELFARWSGVIPDDSRANGEDFHEVTFGANYFLFPESHAAKLTADITWALDAQSEAGDVVKAREVDGLLASTEDNQVYFRVQFQLVF
jgi:hypothetical protein